jgi:glycosyltransferase involved in cell wall biosynthesis
VTKHVLLAPEPAASASRGAVPSFSVLVAAYQAAHVVGEALESAFGQTVPPHEVIVCDDGSTDDLAATIAPFRERIIFLRRSENRGEAAAKNAAARAASGDFVTILDADDVYLPTRLEALGELAAARPDLDILTTDAYLELAGRRVRRCYGPDWPFETANQRRAILERNFVFGLAAVRRERLLAVGGFDETIRWTTDWDCWIRLLLDGSQVGAVAEPLALYRVHETSLSASRADLVRGRVQTLRKTALDSRLTPDERIIVRSSIASQERDLAVLEVRAALLARPRDLRRRLLALALRPGVSVTTRGKAFAAATMPALAARIFQRREAGAWTGAAGIRGRSDGPDSER